MNFTFKSPTELLLGLVSFRDRFTNDEIDEFVKVRAHLDANFERIEMILVDPPSQRMVYLRDTIELSLMVSQTRLVPTSISCKPFLQS